MIYEVILFGIGCVVATLVGKVLYSIWLGTERKKIRTIIIDWGWDKQQVKEAMDAANFPITRDFVYEKLEEL
jgi:hypothetical protein